VVVGSCAGDDHALASAIVADLLRGEQFLVVDLGADTPVEAFAEAALQADRLATVLVGVSVPGLDAVVADTVRGLLAAGCRAPVLVGGAAVRDERHARALGAYGWSGGDAASAVHAVLVAGDRAESISV
jgi:methanogenic corrinoid protein MtbC1